MQAWSGDDRRLSPLLLAGVDPPPQAAEKNEAAKPDAAKPQADHQAVLDQLKQARALLAKQKSVRARIVETVTVYDHSIKAEGRYLQGNLEPNDRLLRLELKMKVGGTNGSLLEICDGQVLTTRHSIGKETTVTRRSVTQILDEVSKRGSVPANLLIADLGLGGIPALLASIEKSMRFNGSKKDTLRDRPVNVLQGTWNEALLTRWQGAPEPGVAPRPLPVFIPDVARIYLDQTTGFPLRILYLKKIPNRKTLRPMLTLDFFDVVLGQPIDRAEFSYEPPPSSPAPIDITQQYLARILPPEPAAAPPPPAAGSPPKAP